MWIYNGKKVKNVKDLPENTFGFIYRILNVDNNKFYIGKKQLFFTRKTKRSKKARAQKDSRKRFEQVVKESDWLEYNGSCKQLLEDIKNGAKIKKEILFTVKTKRLLSYYELKFQFTFNVLENNTYNDNIAGKFFRSIFVKD